MTDEGEIAVRLGRLSLAQKVRLLTGADSWALHAEPAIGLRRVVTSDGPAGVRGERWDERSPSANVPSPTALAATWDEGRVARIGELLAAEARRKGVDVLLAPTVNLHRTPYGGRHFECLSEDPLLTGRIGAAYVGGVQSCGVAATVKHFVANDQETDRLTVDVHVGARALRELYLAPFETIVREAGVWAVMAAYNSLHGDTMTENPLVRDVLEQEWGFDGVVVSDWNAVRSVAAAGEGLTDLAMPGPAGAWGEALLAAVEKGTLEEAALDGHVLRLLRLASRVGALEGVAPATPPPPPWEEARIAAELRGAAAAGFVLARNRDAALPVDAAALSTVAVIGPNAAAARTLGGGSATVFPPHVTSPLEGIRAALPDAEVTYAVGCRGSDRVPALASDALRQPDGEGPGVEVRFFHRDGGELARERREVAAWLWWGEVVEGVPVASVARIEVRTRWRTGTDGPYLVGASGLGEVTLSLDGEIRLRESIALAPGSDVVEAFTRPPQAIADVELSAEQEVEVMLAFVPATAGPLVEAGMVALQLNATPLLDDEVALAEAVAAAARADLAIVVVGTSEEVESEGFDRESLGLGARQDALVDAVCAVNSRTLAVVNSGAPVLLPWAERAAAVLLTWFPGQEFGHALADVVLGRTEPGGRLPTTWPASEAGLPSVTPVDGALVYEEGLFVGYRGFDRDGREPLFPFGHGLGYTSWEFHGLTVPDAVRRGAGATVRVELTNVGDRPGREVVQLYASKSDGSVERPPRWLVGFAGVSAAPGERVRAEIVVAPRAFAHWTKGGWATESGAYVLEAGRSSRDLSLRARTLVA